MKGRLRVLPMKTLAALCLLAGSAPIWLGLGWYLCPESPAMWVLPSALSCLWGVLAYLLPGKWRTPFTLLGAAALIAFGGLILLPKDMSRLLLLVPCFAILFLLPPAFSQPVWQEWPAGLWLGGVVSHLAGQIMATLPPFSGLRLPLSVIMAVYVFLMLMYLNRSSIRDGMHGSEKAPSVLRVRNTLLVTGLFAVCLLSSCWKTLAQWIEAGWEAVKKGIWIAVQFLLSLLPEQSRPSQGMPDGGDMLAGLGDSAEPSAFALFMEKALKAVAFLILAFLIVLALRGLWKSIRRLINMILERFRRFSDVAAEDYVDETESTVNWEEKSQSVKTKLQNAFKRPARAPKWEDLDGRARVRRLYQQFLSRHPDAAQKTAREALSQDRSCPRSQAEAFIQLYEQARYSDHPVSSRDADQLRQAMK